ncbi:LamG-like jellyroll fold domain-containing protein [Bradyrhizobium sp.]|uniref:LamG-like jellyroll fold domain-containing protein n=1 Tax=Bradyrhizobium sp. TaxID=376 RepID=UPI0025C53617|nr:LamG-like jellyroll fold domain-containing protein [Bradyrhizobium sp.]MBV8921117.1 hypothetical protein [Bradyrhizobium sp.]
MSALATLSNRLTLPYQRGAEFAAIPLGADTAGVTAIGPYGFDEYGARWGQDPQVPAYVIAPRTDIAGDDVGLSIGYTLNGIAGTATVTVPSGTRAGTGFLIPLPSQLDASLRLTSLTAAPRPAGTGSSQWEITALLGTLARLVFLLGAEKDALARVRSDVRKMRFVDKAFGAGLDALGRDMRVRRFPPRPYSYDDATVALWHLDEIVPNGGSVVDQATRTGVPGHPGTVAGAVAGAAGKYATGFAFPATGGAITVAASTDFDIGATADATIEAFVSTSVPGDTVPRAIVARRASETAAGSVVPGWSLCVVNARGFNANLLFAICDGAHEIRIFADLSIGDSRFHHVAGIVDRTRQRARLFVDGVQRATASIAALGAVTPPDGVRFGSTATGNNLAGTIDEVRISKVARTTFHPALGEDDDAYRARLRIFRHWVLPTPANVIAMINQAAPFPTDPAPYQLFEANRATQVAQCPVRIVPATLGIGGALAADGSTARDESVAGTPADDVGFDPSLDLVGYVNAGVDASADPGHGRMQAGAAKMLDALIGRLGTTPGKLVLTHSFDVAGPTPLHAVGRALRLRHTTLAVAALGALAHRAGFAYVRNLGAELAVAVAAGERLLVIGAPAGAVRADAGSAFDLTIAPALPLAGTFSWTVIAPAAGRVHLAAHSADPASLTTPVAARPRVRLVLDGPGDVAVRIEYGRSGRTRSGTLSLRVDPVTLADGHGLDTVGNPDPDPATIVGLPDANFDPTYLVTHPASPAIDFGANPNNAKMQVVTRDALDALVALLVARGTAGRLRVTQALVPGGPGVESVGRRLVLGHETLDAGVLGALASRFFDYVARAGAAVSAFMRPDSWIEIVDAVSSAPLPAEVVVGTPLNLAILPGAPPAGVYNWSTRVIGAGAGSFDTVLRPTAHFTPSKPGLLMLAVTFVQNDSSRAAPYSFELRLKPALDVAATNIPKDQYDIIMNVLDAFHPIGIEVRTDRIRQHVREIVQDPTKAFPAYSFSNFRV